MNPNSPSITLRDGRRLGYAEYGEPGGLPVFGFFGAAGRNLRPPDEVTLNRNVRLITVERPGFGLSDFKPKRTLLDWPDDVSQLADALGLKSFAVIGASQGGPFAAACAYKLPDRLTAATLVSALAPFDVPGLTQGMAFSLKAVAYINRNFPGLMRGLQNLTASSVRSNPQRMARRMLRFMPEADRRVLDAHPSIRDQLIADGPEVYRQGGEGITHDMILATGPWGFRPEDIRARVYLWQGELDRNVPPAMGRYLAQAIPRCRATFVPGEGHYMIYNHWDDILRELV